MLRNVLLLMIFIFASVGIVKAETCTAEMKNQEHELILNFTAWGKEYDEACNNAEGLCEIDLRNRNISGVDLGAYCKVDNQSEFTCSAYLKDHRNRYYSVLFEAKGPSMKAACSDVKTQCEGEIALRGGLTLYCQVVDKPSETKVCYADLHRRFGVVESYQAEATGPVSSGVLEKACKAAMVKCRSAAERYDRCFERVY